MRFFQRQPGSPFLFLIVLVTVFGIGWGDDYQSCVRSAEIRSITYQLDVASARKYAGYANRESGFARQKDWDTYRRVSAAARRLSVLVDPGKCLTFFPPTG